MTLRLILAALAAYRLARLVAIDLVGAPVRRLAARMGDMPTYLASCPWCLSVWLSPAPTVALIIWPDNRALLSIVGALAVSALVGVVHTVVERLENFPGNP